MTGSAADNNNDSNFCWEQVSSTHQLFRISRVFAPRACVDKLLPIYGLFSVVEQIASAHSDEDIARSKLHWWRNECLQNNIEDSQHPILKEMVRSGAADDLRKDNVADLLDGAASRLSADTPADMQALKNACVELYRPQLELELDVCGLPGAAQYFSPGLLARNGLAQLLREAGRRKEQGGYWWVPLQSLARHSINRVEIMTDPGSPGVIQLFTDVLGDESLWGNESLLPGWPEHFDYSAGRHILALSGLYSRKLRSLKEFSPGRINQQFMQVGPADLLAAWKHARNPVLH